MEHRRRMKGTLHINSLETDQVTEASITVFKNKYVLDYVEESEGWTGSRTRLTVDVSDPEDPRIKIVRRGAVEGAYSFVNHQKTAGFYRLPEGELALEVDTTELKVAIQDNCLNAVLSAWMTIQKEETIPVQIVMEVTWD